MKNFTKILALLLLFSFPAAKVNSQAVFNPDTVDITPGIPVVYDLVANDVIPAGDSVKVLNINANGINAQKLSIGVYSFSVNIWGSLLPVVNGSYSGMLASQVVFSQIPILFRIHDHSSAYLDTNNVKALFHANGSHFFRENAEYFVPKASGVSSIFSFNPWIGGKDEQSNLHLAGQKYGQGPGPNYTNPHLNNDFFAGPVMNQENYSVYQDTIWNYIWKINKSDLDYYKAHWSEPGYVIPHDILTWPGNGDTTLGQAWHLAPFYDMNGDGVYDPQNGDCPEIRGDQALYFIFNDDRNSHLETLGEKLKVEIHGMAYAFDIPGDSAMSTTTFINYRFYNRSEHTYDSTFIGFFNDFDLGFPMDDYIGCDVERNMAFAYNSDSIDGPTGTPGFYGPNPPVQGIVLLSGPLMDADGLDNPRYDNFGAQLCDFSVNGSNFSDDVVDNERYGMTGFMYSNSYNSGVPVYMQDPDLAPEYYNYLRNRFKDGEPLYYGGNGRPGFGSYGPVTRFMFPGSSDSIDWGPSCNHPDPKNWTEETAGNNPSDRRAITNSGPFTFAPGDMQEIDIAFIWARDYSKGTDGAMAKLRSYTDQIKHEFEVNLLSNGQPFIGIPEKENLSFKVYPNPAGEYLTAEFSSDLKNAKAELINSNGNTVISRTINSSKVTFDISNIPSGLYILKATSGENIITEKVIVR